MNTSVTASSQNASNLSAILASELSNAEPTALASLQYYREAFGARVAHHGGNIIQSSGNLFLAAFEEAAEAVNCGISLQEQFARRYKPQPNEVTTKVKIGIHFGELLSADGTFVGGAVEVAKALLAIVPPAKIYLTRDVFLRIRMVLALKYDQIGRKNLGTADPKEVLSVAWEAVTENLEASLRRLEADDFQRATVLASKLGIKSSKKASPIIMFVFLLFLFLLFKFLKWI